MFWAFLCQILAGIGCRGAVKRVQSWAIARGRPAPSSNPSAYCQARNRLPVALLDKVFAETATRLVKRVPRNDLWHGRRVKLVDGTGLSAADTPSNQAEWPQHNNLKPGCGFPELKLVGLFCLHSGALPGWGEGNKHVHELTLWRKLWHLLCPGDVVLGDRAFGSFACECSPPRASRQNRTAGPKTATEELPLDDPTTERGETWESRMRWANENDFMSLILTPFGSRQGSGEGEAQPRDIAPEARAALLPHP